MRFDIVTLFPQIFSGYQTQSLLAKAIESGLVSIQTHNLRDWSTDTKHQKVDDRPFGGGPGMLISAEPTVLCVEELLSLGNQEETEVILLTPRGRTWNQKYAEELAESRIKRFIVLCGRYEGFDQRVIDILKPTEISIGDYVLNGGEVAAMVLVDSLIRLVPGVLGDENSSLHDSFSRANRLLEYPQYTRPREFRGLEVPEVLLGGNHEAIAKWRHEQSIAATRARRGELLRGE